MSDIPTQISTDPKLRIEELFVEMLTRDPRLADQAIVAASDRDAVVPPNHIFVYCTRVVPLMPSGQNYRAQVAIAVVSNIDDDNHATRKATVAVVLAALSSNPPPYSRPDATLLGWPIVDISESSTDQQASDVIALNAAAYVAG